MVVITGVVNGIHYAQHGAWIGVAMVGVVLPVATLVEWSFSRRRENAEGAADRMLILVLAAMLTASL
jgi:hypothetical protein